MDPRGDLTEYGCRSSFQKALWSTDSLGLYQFELLKQRIGSQAGASLTSTWYGTEGCHSSGVVPVKQNFRNSPGRRSDLDKGGDL